ncbi:MAG: DUF4331 domain-containing protein [Gloeobacteraceae cyanobacterium ES-bin-144]|nr:DUF4331 domain-containing protein [Verrucomicrobiales bacterium]
MKITTLSTARYLAGLSIRSSALLFGAAACFTPLATVRASSHSDAPLIKLDPQANLTDVYAFVRQRPTGERALVVEVAVRPFSEPGDGLAYEAFSPDALYSIHITDPKTGAEAQRYDFKFSAVDAAAGNYKNTGTILRYGRGTEIGPIVNVGDARQNFVQTYDVTRVIGKRSTSLNGSTKLMVPPPNVGMKTTPAYNDANGAAVSGATSRATLDTYTKQTTYDLPTSAVPTGFTVFCGPREDGFFADTPAISDLLESRILDNNGTLADGLGQDGNGVDDFKGFNVLHYGIVIPLSALPSFQYTGALQTASTGVGVYASVSRPRVTLRNDDKADVSVGPFVQVNRLGNPLFNEALVALVGKDKYNRTSPTSDAALFATYAKNPELAVLINAVFGTGFQTTNRADLQAIFIPDVIRVNTTTAAVKVPGEAGFNRLSFIGGDTIANGAGVQIPSGWPNGRRPGDDVVDIALTAIASGPSFTTITVVGDNVPENDQTYNRTFPYLATPHSGTDHSKDSGSNVGF